MTAEVLAERIFWHAAEACGYQAMTGWPCADQNHLGQALAEVHVELPACQRLVDGLGSADLVMGGARDGQREIEAVLRELRQQRLGELTGL